jgi:tRNA uridine 5-carbamoylmethylation protein Kti12
MNKDSVIYTRVPPDLKLQVDNAARQRNMHTSEFVRYLLQHYFEPDSNLRLVDSPVSYQVNS